LEVVGVDVGFEPLPPFPFDEELEGVEEGLGIGSQDLGDHLANRSP